LKNHHTRELSEAKMIFIVASAKDPQMHIQLTRRVISW